MNFVKVSLNHAPTSNQLISAFIQFSATPWHYWNQNIASNSAISPNLGQKMASLEALILNTHLDFLNSEPKFHFWANSDRKSQICPFCLTIGTHSILRVLILIPTLVFWVSNPKPISGQIWAKRIKVVVLHT